VVGVKPSTALLFSISHPPPETALSPMRHSLNPKNRRHFMAPKPLDIEREIYEHYLKVTTKPLSRRLGTMKRVWMAAFVLLISFAFVSMAFAQAKPAEKPAAEKPAAAPEKAKPAMEKPAAPAEKPAEPAKEEKKEEKPAEKPKPKLPAGFIGTITNIDNTAQTLTVKGAKESITVDTTKPTLKGYKSIEQMKVGDKIAVQYAKKEGVKITKIASAKPEKKEKAAAPAEKKEKPAGKKEAPAK
jgi:hypothetical protein